MKKVLFTHSYFYRFDKKQWNSQQYYPPLGTITAAAFTRQEGYPVELFDTNLADSPGDILPKMRSFKPDYLVIYDDGFNYLTKMCLTLMRDAAFELCSIGKENNCIVIVSSSDSTDHFEEYLDRGADVILLGEGELSLKEVLYTMNSPNADLSKVAGIVFRKEGKTINTGRREPIDNLDALPMAAWDLIDIDRYKDNRLKHHGYFSLNIATTRGCPYSCNWCAKPIYGRKYNVRSPEKVIEEIEFLMNSYGATYFWICDDIFGLKPGWVQRFRDLTKERKLNFRYMMQSRVDVMLKDDAIQALAESGLDIVWVGAESGSQKVLDAMEKGIRIDQVYEARKKLKAQGVRVAFFLQFGYPGENMDDIRLTEKMLFDLMPDDIGISVSYPLPGTKFYDMVKVQLSYKANWTDSDELALMFKNTYPPEFYKRLHRYVHKRFRKRQGVKKILRFLANPLRNYPGILRTIATTGYYLPMTFYYRILMNRAQNRIN